MGDFFLLHLPFSSPFFLDTIQSVQSANYSSSLLLMISPKTSFSFSPLFSWKDVSSFYHHLFSFYFFLSFSFTLFLSQGPSRFFFSILCYTRKKKEIIPPLSLSLKSSSSFASSPSSSLSNQSLLSIWVTWKTESDSRYRKWFERGRTFLPHNFSPSLFPLAANVSE